jgi:hypothetical protein
MNIWYHRIYKILFAAGPKLINFCLGIIICFHSIQLKAQILRDSQAIDILRNGMQKVYNLEFKEAESIYNTLSNLYPGHPVLSLFNGMKIYWENFPILSSSPASLRFESEMNKCIGSSEMEDYPSPEYEAEYLLANICARGLLLLFYADNDVSGEVMSLAKRTYRPLMRSFNFTSSCSDFYYFTGVYNYYRDAYPRVYPVYKTVAFMFPQGDMELGLLQLEKCGENSLALRAEAYFILFWIRMNFETDFKAALPYSRHLVDQYPSNPLYKVCYIKNLLLLQRYDEAEKVIMKTGKADGNSFYKAVTMIFNGIIQEKKYKDKNLARDLYSRGISDISAFGAYGNEYAAYGYFGLSRLGEGEADNHERRMNHRKAMDLVDFKKITFDE